jgi:hypothetical protein
MDVSMVRRAHRQKVRRLIATAFCARLHVVHVHERGVSAAGHSATASDRSSEIAATSKTSRRHMSSALEGVPACLLGAQRSRTRCFASSSWSTRCRSSSSERSSSFASSMSRPAAPTSSSTVGFRPRPSSSRRVARGPVVRRSRARHRTGHRGSTRHVPCARRLGRYSPVKPRYKGSLSWV